MIQKPTFRPSFHAEPVASQGVVLLSEHGHLMLKGKLYGDMAPLIDGSHTADEIVDCLARVATPAEVYYALMQLEDNGYIIEVDGAIPRARAAFWDAFGLDPSLAEGRLRQSSVSVTSVGDVPSEPLARALEEWNIDVRRDGHLSILLTDDYLHERLRDFNTDALTTGRPWLLAKPIGTVIWIGPIFRPHQSACWECLAQRLRANREIEAALQRKRQRTAPFPTSRAGVSTTVQMALSMVATEAAKWIGGVEPHPHQDSVVTVDVTTLHTQEHVLVRRPQCPCCGIPPNVAFPQTGRMSLRSRTKHFTGDGGHRAATPEQTLAKYAHHVSPITGAVPTLRRESIDDAAAMHVYTAGHNLAVRPDLYDPWHDGFRTRSAGKGLTDVQAKVSGLCESLERYCGYFHGDEPRAAGTYRQLAPAAIHPNACMLFSERQYRQREACNARGSPLQIVPEPFDERAELEWTRVWSLTSEQARYVPTSYLYYGYPIPHDKFFCWADSNGNAAGNTLEEAILQGFMELVERDSVAIWWYNRVARPAVDLDQFDDPYLQQLREQYRNLKREVWVLDLTTDLKVPACAAISRRCDDPVEQIILGFGAHFDPKIAVSRALAELNQSAVFVRAAASLDAEYVPADVRAWLATATIANQPHLSPDRSARCAAYRPASPCSDDLREDVRRCCEIVGRQGMEMLVLEQTRPDIALPVVKVIVPGLRHFWARFAPGRLYEVPVTLGWRDRPLAEDQLNPIPVFF